MTEISTLLYQYLTNQFSKLDWEPGSVIRELVAEPLVKLSEQAVAEVDSVYASLDIKRLLESPEEHSAEIDELFDMLGLAQPPPSASTGTVQILFTVDPSNVPQTLDVAAGTTFSYEDVILQTTASTTVAVSPLWGPTCFALINVTSVGDGVSLAEGTPLNWSGVSNADVYSATVYNAITGGVPAYTATQKINLIRQHLFPQSLTCREGLIKTINSYTPGLVYRGGLAVDCLPAINQVLYVKTSALNAPISELGAAQHALDQYMKNTGCELHVTKPRCLTLRIYLTTSAPLNTVLRNEIANAVNGTLLNPTQLGDNMIAPLLAKSGITLSAAGIYTLEDPQTGETHQSRSTINLEPFMHSVEPCAVYSSIDGITFAQ